MNTKKPHLNVSTIGHVDHGKTTLTAALTIFLSKSGNGNAVQKKYEDIDNAPEEKARGITINASHIEYSTRERHFSHSDCPGHADYIKNMLIGIAKTVGAILVVSALDGVMPQTREHILLAQRIGVRKIIVFINKMDQISEDDKVLVEMIEEDILALCIKYGYKKEDILIIYGSAKAYIDGDKGEYGEQAIMKLVDALDKHFEPEEAIIDVPLLFTVGESISISGRGTVATGKVIRGKIDLKKSKEQKVVISGPNKKDIHTAITSMEIFKKQQEEALPGDDMGLLLRGVKKEEVRRGDIICSPEGVLKKYSKFTAEISIISHEEGGRKKPFKVNYKPQIYFNTLDITCTFDDIGGAEFVNPGEIITATLSLLHATPLEKETRFIIREGGKTIGAGVVSELIS